MTAPIENQEDATDNPEPPRRLTVVGADSNVIALQDLIRVLNEVVEKGLFPAL